MTKTPPPWERDKPKGKQGGTHLSAAEKASARRAAEKAGRTYPNLVDNMHVIAKRGTKATKKKS